MNSRKIVISRHRTLLGLLKAFGGNLPRLDFPKIPLPILQGIRKKPSFEFVPYRFGCFSFQSYADKRRLEEFEALKVDKNWILENNIIDGDLFQIDAFSIFFKQYSSLKGSDLVREVYRRYPYYAINSKISHKLMTAQELRKIHTSLRVASGPCFFTIGYEGSSFEGYLNRLINNGVRTLVDVRRNPLSRKYGFSKRTLSDAAEKLGIEYIHMPELGISSEKRRKLSSMADYDLLFAAYEKNELKAGQAQLDQLFEMVKSRQRVAITCFEADVCMCHRGRIAQALQQYPNWSYDIRHL